MERRKMGPFLFEFGKFVAGFVVIVAVALLVLRVASSFVDPVAF